MSLASNINQLINTHVAMDQRGKIVKQPALLTQLKDADSDGGRPTTNERPIPANLKAVALLQDIYDEATKHQYAMIRTVDQRPLREILTGWATIEDREWRPFLEHVTLDWIDQIHDAISPTRPRRPLMQPCSACGQKYTPDDDGKRIPAITAWVWDHHGDHIAKPEHWEVQCSNCGAQWHGSEVVKAYWRAVA
ncbi:MAG: hypothetical protein HLX51_11780 [Micrococcaceae bacterium]|nr:hypothetical protein [Micrococcaceae bacterium]